MASTAHNGRLIDRANGYGIIECELCGFIHTDPIPSKEELDKLYRDEYYKEEKPLYIERTIEDLRWWEAVYDDRYDFFEAHLPAGRRAILDVGCGPGYFLKRGLERRWMCLGIEPSRQASSHAISLGVEVLNTFLDGNLAREIGRKFDAIHLSEVLEHVPDPARILDAASGLLNEGGLICCVVPNDYSPVQKTLRGKLDYKPYWLAPPHHINYFSHASLSRLFKKTGFEVIGESSMFPIDFFLLMGDNYIGNDELGRASHLRRKRLDIMLDEPELKGFKRDMYGIMAKHGIGREAVIYGKKESK
ncbi:MAG: class I SAM-dependent methyltransferase [Deltaproteobacteria bacterium]|nr:class I SAM-dependent methyltransferase [Deltaproteobacteria bacterium]